MVLNTKVARKGHFHLIRWSPDEICAQKPP